MSDGTATTVPAIGEMRYVRGNHNHWHLLDFERYELRRADDPGNTLVRDQKTGFCLANAFTTDVCGLDHPEAATVSEGLRVNGSDRYGAYLEGQYLVLEPTTTPAGDYLLVNRVNPTGALLETDASDNAASLRIQLRWNSSAAPTVVITNSCPASIDCPAPPPPPKPQPQPLPDPQSPPSDPMPGDTVSPVVEPQPVPIVTTPPVTVARSGVTMSRTMASRLVRRAIVKTTKQTPRRLRTTCERRNRETFMCNSTWLGIRGVRWDGRVRVWYRERAGQLSWFYDLSGRPSGGKRVVKRSVEGSASAFFSGPGGALYYCAVQT
jgi:hypothetical protein